MYKLFFETIDAEHPSAKSVAFTFGKLLLYSFILTMLFQSLAGFLKAPTILNGLQTLVLAFLEEAARWGFARKARNPYRAAFIFAAILITFEFAASALLQSLSLAMILGRVPGSLLHVALGYLSARLAHSMRFPTVQFGLAVAVHAVLNISADYWAPAIAAWLD